MPYLLAHSLARACTQVEALLRRRAAAGCPARRLLDLGCGRGDLALLLAARLPACTIVCVDSNEASLSQVT